MLMENKEEIINIAIQTKKSNNSVGKGFHKCWHAVQAPIFLIKGMKLGQCNANCQTTDYGIMLDCCWKFINKKNMLDKQLVTELSNLISSSLAEHFGTSIDTINHTLNPSFKSCSTAFKYLTFPGIIAGTLFLPVVVLISTVVTIADNFIEWEGIFKEVIENFTIEGRFISSSDVKGTVDKTFDTLIIEAGTLLRQLNLPDPNLRVQHDIYQKFMIDVESVKMQVKEFENFYRKELSLDI